MDREKDYRASDLISYPEIQARPAREADPEKGITKRFARSYRPARRGLLPYSETHFYRLLSQGVIPAPDVEINGTPMWTGKLLMSAFKKTGIAS